MSSAKLVLYIAASLDGYIATPDGDLKFLSEVEMPGEDYGYYNFVKTIDTVIMGRKTYDKVMDMGFGYPHPDKDSYIITRTPQPDQGKVKFYTGTLADLVTHLKSTGKKNIYCDGGAEIVNELMQQDLIDEYIISFIPILLGEGIRLFRTGRPEMKLELIKAHSYKSGLVQVHYVRK
jgi:dihydrofolate reductase